MQTDVKNFCGMQETFEKFRVSLWRMHQHQKVKQTNKKLIQPHMPSLIYHL